MTPTVTGVREIDITEYRLRFERPVAPSEATQLRGFFGSAFAEEELLHHHHRPDGSLVYKYPRVQFNVIDRTAQLIGLAEGGAIVEKLWRELESARLGRDELPVLEATLVRRRELLRECAEPVERMWTGPCRVSRWKTLHDPVPRNLQSRRPARHLDGAQQPRPACRYRASNCLNVVPPGKPRAPRYSAQCTAIHVSPGASWMAPE